MSVYKNTSFVLPLQKKSTKKALLTIKLACKGNRSTNRGILSVIIYLCSPKKIPISNMKKIWILAVLTICSVANTGTRSFYQCRPCQQLHLAWNEEWKCFRTTHFGCRVERMDLISMGIDRIQKRKQ